MLTIKVTQVGFMEEPTRAVSILKTKKRESHRKLTFVPVIPDDALKTRKPPKVVNHRLIPEMFTYEWTVKSMRDLDKEPHVKFTTRNPMLAHTNGLGTLRETARWKRG